SKHAATYRHPQATGDAFVKIYRRYGGRTALKDRWRASKAENVVHISGRLAAAGFRVPRVLAAAERRDGGRLEGAWVATAGLTGEPLASWLGRHGAAHCADRRAAVGTPPVGTPLAAKRTVLAAVGSEVARLHEVGFVVGDLVPANVWVVESGGERAVAFLD